MDILDVYLKLLGAYGKQGWWPTTRNGVMGYYGGPISDEERLEMCFGAILAQNTSWKNAGKALQNMHSHGMMGVKKVTHIKRSDLAKIIRSSGFHNQKAKRLKIFCSHLVKNYGGSIKKLFSNETWQLRNELFSLEGIGPETADSIMLYAANRPVFVIDAYTKRIFSGLGFLDKGASYGKWQNLFENNLPKNAELFNEYHALIVEHAKRIRNGDACGL